MEIAIATIADIEELTKVEIESKLQSFANNEAIAVDYEARLYCWNTYFNLQSPVSAKPERIVFKAVLNGNIIGYIAGHLTSRHEKDAEIQSFYLLKDQQQKGIGSKLLEKFLNWLIMQNATSLCVGIDDKNPYQQFYLKYDGKYLNPHWIYWDDISALQRKIASG